MQTGMPDLRSSRINLAVATIILLCVGVVMIYSASAIYAFEHVGDSAYYLKRHLVYVAVGVVATAMCMAIDYHRLRALAKKLVIVSVVLLLLLLLPGVSRQIGGAHRWFRVGPLSFQPSEFAKLAMIIYAADYLTRKKETLKSFWRGFVPILAVLLSLSALIVVQPDLGTVVAMGMITMVLCFVGGVRWQHMTGLALSALVPLYFLVFHVAYRRNRVLAFLDPWQDPHGSGFQIIQSLVAFGSGGLCGAGLGQGKQKLLYLPAAYTDFIVSIIGEELGFIGVVSIVLLVVVVLSEAVKIAVNSRDTFGQLLAFGLLSGLAIEAAVNMGVVTGLLPTKGLPFPFISYGGTSLVFNMIYVGLILNVGRARG